MDAKVLQLFLFSTWTVFPGFMYILGLVMSLILEECCVVLPAVCCSP